MTVEAMIQALSLAVSALVTLGNSDNEQRASVLLLIYSHRDCIDSE